MKNNDSIIIKKADEGGYVVIMNKSHYMTMAYSQLDDGVTYKRLSMSSDKTILEKLSKLVNKYQRYLRKKEIISQILAVKQVMSMVSLKSTNLTSLRKQLKNRIVNTSESMNQKILLYALYLQAQIVLQNA